MVAGLGFEEAVGLRGFGVGRRDFGAGLRGSGVGLRGLGRGTRNRAPPVRAPMPSFAKFGLFWSVLGPSRRQDCSCLNLVGFGPFGGLPGAKPMFWFNLDSFGVVLGTFWSQLGGSKKHCKTKRF